MRPTAEVAGTTFTVTVEATDNFFNQKNVAPVTQIVTSDPFDTEPSTRSLTVGATTFAIDLVTAGTQTATATASGWTTATDALTVTPGRRQSNPDSLARPNRAAGFAHGKRRHRERAIRRNDLSGHGSTDG